jgi:deaminated glutathione amidase
VSSFRAACVQLNSGDDVAANFVATETLIREAKREGADFIATPENSLLMTRDISRKLANSFSEADDPMVPAFCRLAAELEIWLLVGSLAIRVRADKTVNRSFLIAPDGTVAARYDKIHLFDVDLPMGEIYRESDSVEGGAHAETAVFPWGKIGLSICYDLRFPQLYRALGQAGAIVFTIPAAFTVTTGQAHWHVLARARAIENGAFVIAPAQCGTHPGGRRTFGHSLIVSPWGEVLADGGTKPGIIVAEIDPALSFDARARIPSLSGDRSFLAPA